MHSIERTAEKLLQDVVHDLRQPLGTIEISAYLLKGILGDADGQVSQHLATIARQVDLSARILSDTVAELGRLRIQTREAESLAFTKSQTAVVT